MWKLESAIVCYTGTAITKDLLPFLGASPNPFLLLQIIINAAREVGWPRISGRRCPINLELNMMDLMLLIENDSVNFQVQ